MNIITLNSKPQSIDFWQNPICFVLTAANVFSVVGVKAEDYLIKGAGATNDGDTIDLSFLDYEFTLTFKTNPDDSGFQLYADKTVNDTVTELQNNYYLTKYFDITVHATTNIKFAAKEVGSQFQITFDVSGCSAYTVGGHTIGVDPVKNPNFKVFVQLLVSMQNQEVYEEYSAAFLDPDGDDKVYYYPGKILKDAFDSISLPTFAASAIGTWLAACINYQIQYAEFFGTESTIHLLHGHKSITLIDGKLHNDKWPTHNFLADLATSKMFLSNKHTSQDTWLNAQQYLFFMNYVETDYDITVYFDITYDDGSTTSKAHSIPYLNSKTENIYCIPVGISQLGLEELDPNHRISFYKVYVEHDSTLISEVRYFYLVNQPHNSLQILFKNNYGCLDSMLCYNAKVKLKHDSVFIEKLLPHDYDIENGNDSSAIKEQSITISTNTGYLSAAEVYQMAELFENNSAYLVGKTSFIKIELISNSFTLIDRKNDLQNFELKFRISTKGTTSFNEIL
jgi:hypothetical protein